MVLREIIQILSKRHQFADVWLVEKSYASNDAPEAELRELQVRLDAAIVGTGDQG